MSHFKLTYKPYGSRAILVQWPQKIDREVLEDVLKFKKVLSNKYIKEKVYIKSAYNSILVSYDFTINNIYDEISQLQSLYSDKKEFKKESSRQWKIPVCYDEEFGIDLSDLSRTYKLPVSDIIAMHLEASYLVYFIGFLPGFLYLGGLHDKLHFPRRASPRLKIKKGAVAIGGMQTGIYPSESPGGWNIIGNSPVNFFDPNNVTPCFAKSGDEIQFYSVSKKEYHDIKVLVEAGVYQIESEVIDD